MNRGSIVERLCSDLDRKEPRYKSPTFFTLIPCRLSTDPEMYDLGWLWMVWMFIIRNSIGCGQCLRPKMLSDIFILSFTLFLPNWLLISIRIYSGIARFPCDSMAFLYSIRFLLGQYLVLYSALLSCLDYCFYSLIFFFLVLLHSMANKNSFIHS